MYRRGTCTVRGTGLAWPGLGRRYGVEAQTQRLAAGTGTGAYLVYAVGTLYRYCPPFGALLLGKVYCPYSMRRGDG